MNIIDKVKTRVELFSLRDHITKTLKQDLGLDLKQRKIDEISAHILGAKNWNTAYGMVVSIDPLPKKPRLILAKPPAEPSKPSQMWERAASMLYVTLIEALEEHCQRMGSNMSREMVINYLGWREFRALSQLSHLSANTKAKLCEQIARLEGSSITALATPTMYEHLVTEIMNNVSNYHIFSEIQAEDAMSCIMDSQYEPENEDMLIYRMDQTLANKFLSHTGDK